MNILVLNGQKNCFYSIDNSLLLLFPSIFSKVKLLTRVVTLLPGESRPAFWLRYLKKQPDGFTAYVTLRTNVTTFHVPLSVHNGKVKVRPM